MVVPIEVDVLVIGTGEGGTTAAYKVLIEEETDLLLGAHLLGPHAEEVINLFAVAMHTRLPARELQKLLFAYPTSASDIVYML
jgi:glutathione reductase (NADPH)